MARRPPQWAKGRRRSEMPRGYAPEDDPEIIRRAGEHVTPGKFYYHRTATGGYTIRRKSVLGEGRGPDYLRAHNYQLPSNVTNDYDYEWQAKQHVDHLNAQIDKFGKIVYWNANHPLE